MKITKNHNFTIIESDNLEDLLEELRSGKSGKRELFSLDIGRVNRMILRNKYKHKK